MMDVTELRKNLKNLEDKQAYVKWWAKRSELDLILNKLNINYEDIKDALDVKEEFFAIYLGYSKDGEIGNYLNYQLNDKHTKSTMKSGLSTFRRSVASIVSSNMADADGTNKFLDKLKIEIFYIDYPARSPEAKNELERIVSDCLKERLYPLNINGNNHPLAENIKNNLKELRKESKKRGIKHFSPDKDENPDENDSEKTDVIDMQDNKMWLVFAGENSIKIDIFKKNNFVGIGWKLNNLSGKSKKDIDSEYHQLYPNDSNKRKGQIVPQIYNFLKNIKIGDYIITADGPNNEYYLGKCTSDYYFSNEKDDDVNIDERYHHCRDVEWSCTIIKKDDLSEEVINKIPKKKSVIEVKDEDVKKEILEFVKIKPFQSKEKRNLIYFGAPGTGKSYNLNKDVKTLLTNHKDNYERVTFHPDYTYANFVGTYKPVPKGDSGISYEYVPGPFMRMLVKALQKPSEPFVLIIEEINRANVAAVFGDVFQLLDRDKNDDSSEYSVNASEDMKNYIKNNLMCNQCYAKSLLGEDYNRIIIPSNMFIWATMNSADQGVFTMDTAFKRRWDFKYFSINNNETSIENINVNLNGIDVNWNVLRKAINDELLSYKINEDKCMGSFFAFNEFMEKDIDVETFKDIFKNKIIMYLFEDAARAKRNDLFRGAKSKDYVTYSEICEKFDKIGIEIFCDNIKSKFISDGE